MKKQKDGKSRRSKIKTPSLVKKYNSRVKQEYIDFDYLDKLNKEELQWLNKFADEYINASFSKDEENIDETAEGRKASYDRNNARNRCLYGRIKNKVGNTKVINYDNAINLVEETLSKGINPSNMENAYVDYLETQEITEFIKDYLSFMKSFKEPE